MTSEPVNEDDMGARPTSPARDADERAHRLMLFERLTEPYELFHIQPLPSQRGRFAYILYVRGQRALAATLRSCGN
jgi:hypothetical protein